MSRPQQQDAQPEKISSAAPRTGADTAYAGYDPLATCPEGLRGRYRRMAGEAAQGHRRPMMRLMCLSCVGWQQAEVARCEIRGCPLWRERTRYLEQERRR